MGEYVRCISGEGVRSELLVETFLRETVTCSKKETAVASRAFRFWGSWFPVFGNAGKNGRSQSLFEHPGQSINKSASLLKSWKSWQSGGCKILKHNRHLAAREANAAWATRAARQLEASHEPPIGPRDVARYYFDQLFCTQDLFVLEEWLIWWIPPLGVKDRLLILPWKIQASNC